MAGDDGIDSWEVGGEEKVRWRRRRGIFWLWW